MENNNNNINMTNNISEIYKDLHRAAGFDANRTYPILFQHLGYRKLIAEQLLRGGEHEKIKELEELYKRVNNEIKMIIGF